MEVLDGVPGIVPVRDSKVPHGPSIPFSEGVWALFVGELRSGTHRL
ncbi:DUF397 domain-containing protein [Streptomyces sp. NPDC048566]